MVDIKIPLKVGFISLVFLFMGNWDTTAGDKMGSSPTIEQIIGLLAQNLRPIHTLGIEYIVETSNDSKSWKLKERVRLNQDFDKGIFKKDSAVSNKNDTSSLTYRQESWDGNRGISLDLVIPYSSDFAFSTDIGGTGFASVYAVKPMRINPLLRLMEGYGPTERLSEIVQEPSRFTTKEIVNENGDKVLEINIDQHLIIKVDEKNGTLLKREQLIKGSNGKVFALDEINVLKTFSYDGRNFPSALIFICRDENGEIAEYQRYTVVPESLKINEKIPDSKLGLLLPIGTQVTDNIENTVYTASGISPLSAPEKMLSDQLDELFEKSKTQ